MSLRAPMYRFLPLPEALGNALFMGLNASMVAKQEFEPQWFPRLSLPPTLCNLFNHTSKFHGDASFIAEPPLLNKALLTW